MYLGSAEELQRWVLTHPEYRAAHIAALAGAIGDFRGMKKKDKASLVALARTFTTAA